MDAIETKIKSNYASIAHILLAYPIKSIKREAGGISTFILDKSIAGKTCKIANKVHSSNNVYLVYVAAIRTVYQKCFSDPCVGKKEMIHQIQQSKQLAALDLPSPDDVSLAEFFVKWKK